MADSESVVANRFYLIDIPYMNTDISIDQQEAN